MKIGTYHLTYCTNIHPGERWTDVQQTLEQYLPPIKSTVSSKAPMGVGLRLSNQASLDILEGDQVQELKAWLNQEGLYVFTMNGFPYGAFHGEVVKDQVHAPDWTTKERLDYTLRLFDILAALLPEGMEGGISTSPISYKYWHSDYEKVYQDGVSNLLKVAEHLDYLYQERGIWMHLDLEPEPDGLFENTAETIHFYNTHLLPQAKIYFRDKTAEEIEALIRRHIQICYDVCHFAVVYEDPADTFQQWAAAQIPIGKIQISAAMKATFPEDEGEAKPIYEQLEQFNESTYLHQVVARTTAGAFVQYRDLPQALGDGNRAEQLEWRTHFHVPIFAEGYQALQSTRDQIEAVLDILKTNAVCRHLEIETYTWEVLPGELQLDLRRSIEREMEWVVGRLD